MAFYLDIEDLADEWEELEAWKRESETEMQALSLELANEPFMAHQDHSEPLPF